MTKEKHGIRFSILDLGKMQCDQNLVVTGSLYATRSCPNKPNRMLDMPIDSILIDVPGYGKILYDLGCDPKGMEEHWPESVKELSPYYQTPQQTLEYQLGLLGLAPEDIRAVILSHNHPSGIALPSREDYATTQQAQDALRTIGVELLDHIIVAEDDYVSLADSGILRR